MKTKRCAFSLLLFAAVAALAQSPSLAERADAIEAVGDERRSTVLWGRCLAEQFGRNFTAVFG